ncbi:MAG: DinB family protein [Candidatus Hodarchaeota archaeon]
MENSIISGLLKVIEEQRRQIREIFGLSNEKLNWRPQAARNSIANLVEHITGAEAFWIQEGIMGRSINRKREREFEPHSRSRQELLTTYENTAKATEQILNEKITDDQLFDERVVRNRPRTILWILLHLVDHSSYHIGQIEYIKGLFSSKNFQEPPST